MKERKLIYEVTGRELRYIEAELAHENNPKCREFNNRGTWGNSWGNY
jgi:hypothetical protein